MINNTLLIESLRSFYLNPYNRDKLLHILNDHDSISLRSIDWFITNYSKKNNSYYIVYEDKDGNPSFDEKNKYRNNMNVFHSYKSQLKAYSKKKFDPFCRRDRILFEIDDEYSVETTLGQLNFFKWAWENGVVDYIDNNYTAIEKDMNSRNSTSRKNDSNMKEIISNNNTNKTRKKREELSISAAKSIKKEFVEIVVDFK